MKMKVDGFLTYPHLVPKSKVLCFNGNLVEKYQEWNCVVVIFLPKFLKFLSTSDSSCF